MFLDAYCDGSRLDRDGAPALLTLAGHATDESVWERFGREWQAVLHETGLRSFHMKDAMANRGEFSDPAWSDTRLRKLLTDLTKVIQSAGLAGYSCTVNLADYERAKREHPRIRPAEAICVNGCMGALRLPDGLQDPWQVRIRFDANERFMKHTEQVWRKARSHRRARGWPRQTVSIEKITGSPPPIQAADLRAWGAGHHHCPENTVFLDLLLFLVVQPSIHNYYNYGRIVREYGGIYPEGL